MASLITSSLPTMTRRMLSKSGRSRGCKAARVSGEDGVGDGPVYKRGWVGALSLSLLRCFFVPVPVLATLLGRTSSRTTSSRCGSDFCVQAGSAGIGNGNGYGYGQRCDSSVAAAAGLAPMRGLQKKTTCPVMNSRIRSQGRDTSNSNRTEPGEWSAINEAAPDRPPAR